MTTKTVKLEQSVYDRLGKIMLRGQTYSQAVDFLLTVHDKVSSMARDIASGQDRELVRTFGMPHPGGKKHD